MFEGGCSTGNKNGNLAFVLPITGIRLATPGQRFGGLKQKTSGAGWSGAPGNEGLEK
jgi:hypothetical protein